MKNKVRRKNIVILVLLIFCLTACGADTWDEHYELGMKYLSDGNYEEAIIEFTAAIEIDEMKPEAYIGAADGYVGMEEYQKAIDILTTGYEKCSDEEIYDKLQKLKAETFSEWGVDELMTLSGIKNIKAGESVESTLEKIGFTQEGIDYLKYMLDNKEDTDFLPAYDDELGKCIGIYTRYYSVEEEPLWLEMIYVSDNSENVGHQLSFNFEDDVLRNVSFNENRIQIED